MLIEDVKKVIFWVGNKKVMYERESSWLGKPTGKFIVTQWERGHLESCLVLGKTTERKLEKFYKDEKLWDSVEVNPRSEFGAEERENLKKYYCKSYNCADYILETTEKTPKEIAEEIKAQMEYLKHNN